jgi:hypothetical protein
MSYAYFLVHRRNPREIPRYQLAGGVGRRWGMSKMSLQFKMTRICRGTHDKNGLEELVTSKVLSFDGIWGLHGRGNLDCGLMGCDAVWCCRWSPTFRNIILPPSSGWSYSTFPTVFQVYACNSFTNTDFGFVSGSINTDHEIYIFFTYKKRPGIKWLVDGSQK